MKTYLDQLQHILNNGAVRGDRTGVGTISCFGLNTRYPMTDGFPAVTTKKLAWKVMSSELLWFISGSTSINDLKAIYAHNKIWDANYEDYLKRLGLDTNDGDMGRVYGSQWRRWRTVDGREIDQLQDAIDLIRNNPDSRRIIVNAWNPGEAAPDQVALPPCHSFFQFYVADSRLSLHMYQRSADMFLGVPFNIASYSLLLHMVAKVTGLEPHEFVHTIGDAHIYLDALDQVKEQISREPLPLPGLYIEDRDQREIDDFEMSDFALENYQSHEAIKAKMAI
ncbi:MAG: thymidylate synthase [Gammaproteobacteria bacterium]|nr:thymidylate synthase [Gammaproteobacteria bacterium]MBT4492936.1 thymidylate synthase [Gammaproteobacteria bacterium]MBT7369769.1 thymidylate synthase [Gammaproteobacteria bacterium]